MPAVFIHLDWSVGILMRLLELIGQPPPFFSIQTALQSDLDAQTAGGELCSFMWFQPGGRPMSSTIHACNLFINCQSTPWLGEAVGMVVVIQSSCDVFIFSDPDGSSLSFSLVNYSRWTFSGGGFSINSRKIIKLNCIIQIKT